MKNKKVFIDIFVVIFVVVILAIIFFSSIKSTFSVENSEDGTTVTVILKNASENSGGIGYVTLKEGQKLEVEADLTDSSVKIEVVSSDETSTKEVLIEKEFTKNDTQTFELPAGDYNINIEAQKNATGKMKINAK